MNVQIRYTYNIVTDESAEQGDFAECGWLYQGGHFDIDDETASAYKTVSARDALREIPDAIGCAAEVQRHGNRVTIYGEESQNLRSGDIETRAAHLACVDERLAKVIARMLSGKAVRL